MFHIGPPFSFDSPGSTVLGERVSGVNTGLMQYCDVEYEARRPLDELVPTASNSP